MAPLRRPLLRRVFSGLATLVLAACAGGVTPPSGPAPSAAGGAKVHRVTAALRVRIPKRVHRVRVHGHYVSPATQGLTVSITGPNGFSLFDVVGLTTVSNPAGCTSGTNGTFCTLALTLPPCPTSANCLTADIITYDGITGCPSACEVSGNELSANQGFGFNVTAGAANNINVSLNGIPENVAFVPAAFSTLFGNAASGYSASKCSLTELVSVLPVDADGNYILGPGAPTVGLQSENTALVSVAPVSATQPNAFLLTHPFSSTGGSTRLDFSATPQGGVGSLETGSTLVSYQTSTEICGIFTEYPVSGNPTSITLGPDNALWFTENTSNKIGRLTTAGVLTEYAIPTAHSLPSGIVAGPDGALWFTEYSAGRIGRVTTSGAMHEYATGITGSPDGITVGSDSNLWFTEPSTETVASITTGGTVTESQVPTIHSEPTGITSGHDGALWFTEPGVSQVGRLTTNLSSVSEFGVSGEAGPEGITSGPDNNLWFSEQITGSIGVMATSGSIVRTVPLLTPNSEPAGITTGPDGALWVAESVGNNIARSTTAGSVTEFAVPTTAALVESIVAGPDGAMWFTESSPSANKIGRLQ